MENKRKKYNRLRSGDYKPEHLLDFKISFYRNQKLDDNYKIVLFDDIQKICFICNNIHEMILVRMFGENRFNWLNKDIVLECQIVYFNRQKVNGFRIIEE